MCHSMLRMHLLLPNLLDGDTCRIGIYELNQEIVGCENAFWDVLQD